MDRNNINIVTNIGDMKEWLESEAGEDAEIH